MAVQFKLPPLYTLTIQGISSFISNWAKYGGGIHSESSNLTFARHHANMQGHHPVMSATSVALFSILQLYLELALSTTQHSGVVEHSTLMLLQLSAFIHQQMYISKTIVQLSLVVQYML